MLSHQLALCSQVPELLWQCFWISKDFSQPEFFIGQTVLHFLSVPKGQIAYPVLVIGIFWTGSDWEYAVSLPPDHPWFVLEENEIEWVNDRNLESV